MVPVPVLVMVNADFAISIKARSMLILGFVIPFRGSVTDVPFWVSATNTSLGVAEGFLSFKTAHAPATWGAAMDVPGITSRATSLALGMADNIHSPGANKFKKVEEFEKQDMEPGTVTPRLYPLQLLSQPEVAEIEPTLIAVEMHAGDDKPSR
jgi:hypothetical protein